MAQNQKNHYKDDTPANTVRRIQNILKQLHLDLTETWVDTNGIGTYTLRVEVTGTAIGSNGKGVTKELARASAYSEFMERLQNLWLARWNHLWKKPFPFLYFADEKMLPIDELLNSDSVFLRMFFEKQDLSDADPAQKKEFFLKTQKLNFSMTGEKEKFLSLPFYHVNSGNVEYLPYYTYTPYYLSNGMCAGNTREEALVQGFAEILERVVHKRILEEKPVLPDIPEAYMQKYPEVYEKYLFLRKNSNYDVIMKDCSLGGKFPVAGLVIIEKNTGTYGIKLGCHPDYGIAMERTITEAAQAGDILQYSKNSHLDFTNQRVSDKTNILNGFKTGFCQFPYETFCSDSHFSEMPDVSEMNNSQLLQLLTDQITEWGYDILIRDVSYLNYPSFHILVPGLSEVFELDAKWYNAYHTKFHLMKLLNYPQQINRDNVRFLISTMDFFANTQLENTMRSYSGVLSNYDYPGEEYHMGWLYMTAMGCFLCGEYRKAADRLRLLLSKCETASPFYLAVFQYMSGMAELSSHAEVMAYMQHFFDEEICGRLDSYFADPEQVFVRQYPQLDFLDATACRQNGICDYPFYQELITKYQQAQTEHPIAQEQLAELFRIRINT